MDALDILNENVFMAGVYVNVTIYILLLLFLIILFRGNAKDNVIHIISICMILFFSYEFSQRDFSIGTDTETYRYLYEYAIPNLNSILEYRDPAFYLYMKALSSLGDYRFFLFVTALLYMGLIYISAVFLYKERAYLCLVIFFIYPYFLLFGINGIRNGLASSFMLLSISLYYHRKKISVLFSIFSCLLHSSMFLPMITFYILKDRISIKILYGIWCLVFLFSLLGQSYVSLIANFVPSLYVDTAMTGNGYRDFVLYSLPILLLGYLLRKKYYNDKFCKSLLVTFIVACMLQIMTIRFPYGVRFAYLSGFLLPILPLYMFRNSLHKQSVQIFVLLGCLLLFFVKSYRFYPLYLNSIHY